MDQLLLAAASFCFLLCFGYTLFALGAAFRRGSVRGQDSSPPSDHNEGKTCWALRLLPHSAFHIPTLLMALGFIFLSTYLYLRGQEIGACPLRTLNDVLIFLGWAIVLIYLLVGPAYRLSLMGAFTAPLVLGLQLLALLTPRPSAVPLVYASNGWVELHAALSMIAYGAFALAGISGLMYLIQERQLKARKASALLYNLPPIQHLAQANGRLIFLGFVVLTIAFTAGFLSRLPVAGIKFWVSAIIWLAYGGIILLQKTHHIAPRRIAEYSVGIFILMLVTLPAIQHLSARI